MEERLVRHLAFVEIADQGPGQRRIEQVGGSPCLHERSEQPVHLGQLGEAAELQEHVGRLVEFRLVERTRPAPAAVAVRFAEIEMMQRVEIRQLAVFGNRRRRLRKDGDDAEP